MGPQNVFRSDIFCQEILLNSTPVAKSASNNWPESKSNKTIFYLDHNSYIESYVSKSSGVSTIFQKLLYCSTFSATKQPDWTELDSQKLFLLPQNSNHNGIFTVNT